MNGQEIIEMARQAGSIDSEDVILTVYNAFAAKEREACALLCEQGEFMTFGCAAQAIRARGEA